jgi:hypothetical protein
MKDNQFEGKSFVYGLPRIANKINPGMQNPGLPAIANQFSFANASHRLIK